MERCVDSLQGEVKVLIKYLCSFYWSAARNIWLYAARLDS